MSMSGIKFGFSLFVGLFFCCSVWGVNEVCLPKHAPASDIFDLIGRFPDTSVEVGTVVYRIQSKVDALRILNEGYNGFMSSNEMALGPGYYTHTYASALINYLPAGEGGIVLKHEVTEKSTGINYDYVNLESEWERIDGYTDGSNFLQNTIGIVFFQATLDYLEAFQSDAYREIKWHKPGEKLRITEVGILDDGGGYQALNLDLSEYSDLKNALEQYNLQWVQ
jgi:hypothetical protein